MGWRFLPRALVAPDGSTWEQDLQHGYHIGVTRAAALTPQVVLVKRDRDLSERSGPAGALPEWALIAEPDDDAEGRFRISVFRQGASRLLVLDLNH